MDFEKFDNLKGSKALKEVDDAIIPDEGKTITPGDEIELIKSIQKEMEQEKKAKGITASEKKELKFIKVFQFIGILVIIFTALAFSNLFIKNIYVLISLYIISGLIIAIYYGILVNIKTRKSMKIPLQILNEISRGKLSYDILKDEDLKKELDKFAIPLDTIIKKMSDVVSKVELSAMDLAGNSDALTYFATSMANKTDDQSSSIIKIDESAKKLNDSMQVIRKSVETAYDISKTSIEEANNSSLDILSLIEEMHRINEMSGKIITTMNFIDDIAAETNLLALNAAIQAAHAGEEGKGFGVVATEIKNLAQSSSKATKTIYDIVESTIDSITKGVKASEKAKRELMKIISSIKTTEDLMSQINEFINTQSLSTRQLKESLENIQELTKNINTDTQNMKSAISNLSGQAQVLTKLISYFEIHHSVSPIDIDSIVGIDENT